MKRNKKKLIFSIPAYAAMADSVCGTGEQSAERGVIDREVFPDGEVGLRIDTDVAGRDVVLFGGTYSDQSTLEIYDLGCAISKYGARSLTFVVPYFGCSTMERATKPGVVVTAKTRSRLLSAIPQTHTGNRIILLDLHSEGIPHYFEGNITAKHVYAKPVVTEAVKKIRDSSKFELVLASTDMGRAKWVESLANDFGVGAAFIMKKRTSGTDTKVLAVSGDVHNKLVVIYDDMIRSGGSLKSAAKTYHTAGAAEVAVVSTHAVFSAAVGNAVEQLVDCKLFTKIAITDSHPNAFKAMNEKLFDIYPVASLFKPHLEVL